MFSFGFSPNFGFDYFRGNFDFPILIFQLLAGEGSHFVLFSKLALIDCFVSWLCSYSGYCHFIWLFIWTVANKISSPFRSVKGVLWCAFSDDREKWFRTAPIKTGHKTQIEPELHSTDRVCFSSQDQTRVYLKALTRLCLKDWTRLHLKDRTCLLLKNWTCGARLTLHRRSRCMLYLTNPTFHHESRPS